MRKKSFEKDYFFEDITERERACFEAGIALGSLFHQFIGMPVSSDTEYLERLENLMERAALLQPYRRKVEVKIDSERIKAKSSSYGYSTLSEMDMELLVEIEYGRTRVSARMKYFTELRYPLMYVEKIES